MQKKYLFPFYYISKSSIRVNFIH